MKIADLVLRLPKFAGGLAKFLIELIADLLQLGNSVL